MCKGVISLGKEKFMMRSSRGRYSPRVVCGAESGGLLELQCPGETGSRGDTLGCALPTCALVGWAGGCEIVDCRCECRFLHEESVKLSKGLRLNNNKH